MFPSVGANDSGMYGKMYYIRCEDDPKYYITVRMGFDPHKRVMKPEISNPVYGDPPIGMSIIDKKTLAIVRSGKLKGLH